MSIVEVAKAAGLSHSTVSRVINNRPGVSPKAAEAVYRAMEVVGYTPPAVRRGRRPQGRPGVSTGNVAVLMIGTDAMFSRAPVTAAVFHAAEKALAGLGFNLLVGQVGAEGRLPPDVARGKIDGLLLHGYAPSIALRNRLRRHPSVWLLSKRSVQASWGDRVTPDNEMIGRIAAEHLLSRGHRRLAFIHVSATHLGYRARAESFFGVIEEYGAEGHLISNDPLDASPSHQEDLQVDRVDRLVERLVGLDPMPTGIFVPRDRHTVYVYRSLRRLGIEPGRDIEVVSCDNEPIVEALDPRPATINVRPELIGRRAVEQLIWRMKHVAEPTRATVTVEPTIVPGSSDHETGPWDPNHRANNGKTRAADEAPSSHTRDHGTVPGDRDS